MRWMAEQMRHTTGSDPIRRAALPLCLAGLATIPAPDVSAHTGLPVAPHDLLGAWNLSPLLLGSLALVAWLYARGVAAASRQAGRGRIVPAWRVWTFAAGLAVLAVALLSPLDALAGSLFSAHMGQHLLLTLIAPPLLLLGGPALAFLWALPAGWRHRTGRVLHHPAARTMRHLATNALVVSVLYATALWLWHWPSLYELALASELIHALEHATLLGAALLFWAVFIPLPGRRRAIDGIGILVAFAAMLHGTILGAMILFAGDAWYPTYAGGTAAWGLSPIDDQRLAGALMMLLAGLASVTAAVTALTGWLGAADVRRARGFPSATMTPATGTLRWHEADAP